nr:hypothetical protein [Spirochaetota bacterium]
DGSFNGYVSWAEKKYCSDYWTAVEKDRNIHKLAEAYYSFIGQSAPGDITTALKRSFEKRMRLLSTTNFGMATPFLAKNREHVVETITHSMESLTKPVVADIKKGAKGIIAKQAINTNDGYEYVTSLLLLQQDTAPFVFKLPMELPQGYTYYMQSKDMLTPVNMFSSNGVSTIFIGRQPLHSGVYHIVRTQPGTKHYAAEATDTMIKNNTITVTVDNGFIQGVEAHGSTILNKMSLIPWIAYNGQDYRPEKITASVLSDGKNGVAAVALRGEIALPENVTRGYFDYTIYLVDDIDMLFVEGTITYPDTPRTTIFKPGMPALARIYDERWQQVIPCPLFAAMTATKDIPFTVIKKNYFGVEDTYKIDYFKHSKENLRLANVNNHITAGYVAVTNSKEFIAVAKDNEVLSNFAFCPLKIDYGMVKGFTVSLNPFGTFFGRQYFQPTWGNGQGFKSAILNGDQYHSGACTYSGTTQRFSLAIAHGRGALQQSVKAQLQSFAHQPFIVAMNEVTPVQQKQKLQSPKGVVALYNNGGVYINFEKVDGAAGYNIYCGNKDALKKIGVTSNTSFFAKNNWDGKPFVEGNTYVAAVSAYDDNGNVNKVPVTYTFVAKPVKESLDLPLTLQLKILYHCLVAQLRW